jgi:hypothetical protein
MALTAPAGAHLVPHRAPLRPSAQPRPRQLRWHRALGSYPRDAQESTVTLAAAAKRTALSQALAASGTAFDIKWVVQESLEQLEPDQLALAASRCAHRSGRP